MERTPEQWRDLLEAQLLARRSQYAKQRRYYEGSQTLPTAPSQVTDKYKRLAELGVTNMCALIPDTINARCIPNGVRLSSVADADLNVWRDVWQANGLDGDCPVAQGEALKVGRCPILVWPTQDTPPKVSVTVEDPDEVAVAYSPGSRRTRLAAMKLYCDGDVDRCTVWTDAEVVSWIRQADRSATDGHGLILPISTRTSGWQEDLVDYPRAENPLKKVPVVELLCKPNVKGIPQPELSPSVIRLQDRINKTMFDAVVAAEDGAFPQRYTIGIEIETDAAGNPVNPLTSGPNRVWALQAAEDNATSSRNAAQIGQLDPYELAGLLSLADASIKHLASISQTPIYYLLSGFTNVGADTIRAAEAGHVAKIRNHQVVFGEAWEEMFRLALTALGRTDLPVDIEIDWAPAETRSPAELADAAIKLHQAGYPFAAIARHMGATQSEIQRLEAERAQASEMTMAPPAPTPVPPVAPPVPIAAN